MPLTPAEELVKTARIARDREALDRALADPNLSDSRHIYKELDLINGAVVDSAGSSNGGSGDVNVLNFPAAQAITASSLPLPNGAATETTIAAILSALQGDRAIASQLFTDTTGTVYLRVLSYNQQTNAYEPATLTLAGAAYTPTLPETALAKSDLDTTETSWNITTAGTGYSIGDVVSQFSFLAQSPPAVIATLWFNQTTQLAIAAPLAGHRRRTDGLAATEATQATLLKEGTPITGETIPSGGGFVGWISSLRLLSIALNTVIGAQADPVATSDTGTFSAIALIKRLGSKILQGAQPIATSIAIALPQKTTITGFLSTGAVNLNLLDATGNGLATDVRNYQSGQLIIASTATTGSYIVESAVDAGFTIGVATVQLFESTVQNANPIVSAIVPTNNSRKFLINLQGVNYLRVNKTTTGGGGVTPTLVLSQQPHTPLQFNVNQQVAANLQATATLAAGQTLSTVTTVGTIGTINSAKLAPIELFNDVVASVLTTSSTTTPFTLTWGCSQHFKFTVLSFNGTSLDVTVEESDDGGVSWYPIYKFPSITGIGTYRSMPLPQSGNRIRYVQTFVGVNLQRSITRYQSNTPISAIGLPKRSGGVASTSDLPLVGRTRRILANNRTGATIYLQVHDKATALANGDVPSGEIYPVVANGVVLLSAADLGEYGTTLGTNPRLGLSSTFGTYTAVTPTNTSLFVEST